MLFGWYDQCGWMWKQNVPGGVIFSYFSTIKNGSTKNSLLQNWHWFKHSFSQVIVIAWMHMCPLFSHVWRCQHTILRGKLMALRCIASRKFLVDTFLAPCIAGILNGPTVHNNWQMFTRKLPLKAQNLSFTCNIRPSLAVLPWTSLYPHRENN